MIDYNSQDIRKLFIKLFVPTLLGMLAVSAVTTVDGIFVGRYVGSSGIAAVNLCVPLIMILTGVGLMLGVGGSVIASLNLGRGKIRYACAALTQSLTAAILISGATAAVLMLFPAEAGLALGSSPTLLPLVKDYLIFFAPSLIFELIIAISMFALRLDGAPNYAMASSIVTALVNVVLDYLFMDPLGMGVAGAALATSISCAIGSLMVLYYLIFKGRTIRLHTLKANLKGLIFFAKCLKVQCSIGLSAMLGEFTLAVLMLTGNLVFMLYLGDAGVGAFGICCYYLPFVFMVGNCIGQSAQPIISYNLSLKRFDRIQKAFRISIETALCLGLISAAFFTLFPELLVRIFIKSTDPSFEIAAAGFPLIGAGFLCFVLNLAIPGYCQSMEKVTSAALIALMRGLIILVPSFIVLPKLLGTDGIWLALTFSELSVLCGILVTALWHRLQKIRTSGVLS